MNKRLSRIWSKQDGVTLIDVMIAMALLAFAVASAGILASSSARVGNEAGRRSQASALANQEIEALHNYRDRMGSTGAEFFSSSVSCGSGVGYYMINTGGVWSMSAAVNTPQPYAASEFLDAATSKVDYARMFKLCDDGADFNVKNVEVSVYWNEPNGPLIAGSNYNRRVLLRSILTNWPAAK